MLKKLRRKIILINMGLVSFVLLAALTVICLQINRSNTENLYNGLQQAIDFAMKPEGATMTLGSHPKGEGALPVPQTPNVVVEVSSSGVLTVVEENGVSFSEDLLQKSVAMVLASPEHYGKLSGQNLVFFQKEFRGQTILALGDASSNNASMRNTILACLALFFGGTLVFFFISLGLSSMAVKPIETAWQKQEQFVADASHELKTPLTVIIANNNIVTAHKDETVAQQSQWLRSTAEEAETMRQLIDQMLMLAKSDSGGLVVQRCPVELSNLVEEQLLYLEPVAYERNVRLDAALAPNVTLDSDPALLQHLVAILVENATKYSPPGEAVSIRLTKGHSIRLSVHNFGPAIPEEDLPHIFDRFFRSDKARSSSGYGLGLAIARSITGNLRGKLSVESSEETGTTFTVEFRT